MFSLNHLREWIAENEHKGIKKKPVTELTTGEKLFLKLWDLEEFKIINSLCNRSKHCVVDQSIVTSVNKGMTAGSSVSDSLGQIYYRIDGLDSRIVFAAVIREYRDWFAVNN